MKQYKVINLTFTREQYIDFRFVLRPHQNVCNEIVVLSLIFTLISIERSVNCSLVYIVTHLKQFKFNEKITTFNVCWF